MDSTSRRRSGDGSSGRFLSFESNARQVDVSTEESSGQSLDVARCSAGEKAAKSECII